MKGPVKKRKDKDDSLFGLLSAYKSQVTYLRVLQSDEDERLLIQLVSNPAQWNKIPKEEYETYRPLRRLEMGIEKLSIKYILPQHIVKIQGPLLNMKLPPDKVKVTDLLEQEGFFLLDIPVKYKKKVLQGIKKLLQLSPQKKYEIIEKCIVDTQEE